MARARWMQTFARWHIWLGWVVGLPVLIWTVSGFYMVLKPIEEVRGNHLRIDAPAQALVIAGSAIAAPEAQVKEMRAFMQDGRAVALITTLDGDSYRVDLNSGARIAPLSAQEAAQLVARRIKGGERQASVRFFAADKVPFDFRRKVPVWQVALDDGTHVYVGRDSGEIEAVRTRWWRGFDFMWGLHILDPVGREDTSHPLLIAFAALSALGALLGCILLFRRRRARPKTR